MRQAAPGPARSGRGWGAGALIVLTTAALLVGVAAPALANGGQVRIARAPIGPWFITVYSSPIPLRTGALDISVLAQDSAGEVVDIPITVEATPAWPDAEAAPIRLEATRSQATVKLYKAAKMVVAAPGPWTFRVAVGSAAEASLAEAPAAGAAASGPGATAGGVVSFEAEVAQSTILNRPYLLAAMILLPLAVLGWFLLGRGERESA